MTFSLYLLDMCIENFMTIPTAGHEIWIIVRNNLNFYNRIPYKFIKLI